MAAQVAAQAGVAAQAVGSWVATQVGVVALVAVQGLCTGTQDQLVWCVVIDGHLDIIHYACLCRHRYVLHAVM